MSKKISKVKTKDRELTESKLLDAAEKIFSKVGFRGATTRAIAKEADTNQALINRYFSGKYGLLLALIERKNNELVENEYTPRDNLEEELFCFAQEFFRRMTSDTHFFRIVVGQFLTDPKFLKKFKGLITQFQDECTIVEHFTPYIKNGHFKNLAHVVEVLDILKTQAFGTVIIEILVKDRPISEVEKIYSEFARDFSRTIASKKQA